MTPFFSVVIPTFRRPQLLQKCLASVLRQTFASFEVIVSDDERVDGESWAMLQEACQADSRIRAVRNQADRGQSANTNNGLRYAVGTWVKLLHDDDELYPQCLERFHAALVEEGTRERVSLACCRNDRLCRDGRVVRWKRSATQSPIEVLDRLHTPLAMYLQQDVGSSVPSCICVNREIMAQHGAFMPSHELLVSAVDTLWSMNLSRHGDRLILNESLVLKRDEPVSVTGGMSDEAMDREFGLMRKLQLEMISPSLRPPSYGVAMGALRLRRGLHRLIKCRSPWEALRLLASVPDPRAWILALRIACGIAIPRKRRWET
jgi:hypothetical protein